MDIPGKDIEGRQFSPVALTKGLDQETNKFTVEAGTLSDCLNYNVTTLGYTRAKGLWWYDGTIDHAITNMWMITVDDDESSTIGANGFTLGGAVSWDDGDSTGTVCYYDRVAGTPDYTLLGVIGIRGTQPAAGDVLVDTEYGTSLTLGAMTYPPSELITARYPDTGDYIADNITDCTNFLNRIVDAAFTSNSDVVTLGTYNTYHGTVPGLGAITGGWQLDDVVYVVRDTYATTFDYGVLELIPGNDVLVPLAAGGFEQVCVARVILTSGSWVEGTAAGTVVFKPSASTADFRELGVTAFPEHLGMDVTGVYITQTVADGSSNMARIPIDSDPATAETKGLVWKGTVRGWEWVDTGWTIDYDTGLVAPNVAASPLFISSVVAATRLTAVTAVSTAANVGDVPYIAWVNPTNVTTDNAAYATASLLAGESTKILKCSMPVNLIPHDDVKIVGITVTVQARFTTAAGARDVDVRLINATNGASFYQSANRARRTELTGAAVDYTYGSSTDTWGVSDISAEDLNDGDIYIQLQYLNNAGVTSQVEIDYVSYEVAYVPNDEKIWFYNGATDVAVGVIHAFQMGGGTWGATPPDEYAYGEMSFHGIDDPAEIGVGMVMRTNAVGGAGILSIASVTSAPAYNLLPSEAEMRAERALYETIRQNYYENDSAEAIYGVSGAGPAFTDDGSTFSFIKTPLTAEVDKPRSIAFHDNRLALGFKTGHVVNSAVGVPNDMSALDDASSWGVGDRVTGLISMKGGVLGVFSESSIRTLEGADAEEGIMRTISSTAGANEYTMQNIVGPYFADNRGVSSVEASQNYGDFDMNRATDAVRSWIQERIQATDDLTTSATGPVCSVAVRNQNQYRLFFADGYILVLYFRADGTIAPSIMNYSIIDDSAGSTDYVPTFINSTILTTGRERIVMGTALGSVFIIDGGDAIYFPPPEASESDDPGMYSPDCYFVLNPVNFGAPDRAHKVYHTVVQGQFYGAQTVEAWGDTNYIFEQTGTAQETIVFGDYAGTPIFNSKNEIDSVYLEMLSDGFSLKLKTTMDGSQPHTFQSVLYRTSPKGSDRNRVSKAY